eukprot:CAMPEP_0196172354 /NCGR_PEP_ID=MMETSP0911-20130528/6066_1 /TAXON_ID=49265 /ORGANISM="Thalassiosira rotula, Strain GSO102" /LENGTH=62 /DNA_ID=CAMNT_0041439345 /DNA_START=835 /DNA_END=1021 /DNA_ORIENTATION=-
MVVAGDAIHSHLGPSDFEQGDPSHDGAATAPCTSVADASSNSTTAALLDACFYDIDSGIQME